MKRTLPRAHWHPNRLQVCALAATHQPRVAHYPLDGIAEEFGVAETCDWLPRLVDRSYQDPKGSALEQTLARISGGLAAPRTLRAILSRYDVPVPPSRPLRVLYVGAAFYETMDSGRWFSLLRRMDPAFPEVAITAVGPEMDRKAWQHETMGMEALDPRWSSRLATTIKRALPCTLAEAVDDGLVCDAFDLVVLHHPRMLLGLDDTVRADAALPGLCAGNVPVYGTSFNSGDFQYDREGASHVGVALQTPVRFRDAHNSIYNEDLLEDSRWGHVLWRARADSGVIPDAGYEARVATPFFRLFESAYFLRRLYEAVGEERLWHEGPGAFIADDSFRVSLRCDTYFDALREELVWFDGILDEDPGPPNTAPLAGTDALLALPLAERAVALMAAAAEVFPGWLDYPDALVGIESDDRL